MNEIDNTPMTVPAVGQLITESFPMGQLEDCCLYVLPKVTPSLAEKAKVLLDSLVPKNKKSLYLNTYNFKVLETMPTMDNHDVLRKAIRKEKYDFLMPLFTPGRTDKNYLLVKTDEDNLLNNLEQILYTAEHFSKQSMVDLLFSYAKDQPDVFYDDMRDTIKSEKFWKKHVISVATDLFSFRQNIQATLPKIKEILKIEGVITHQKKIEMMNRIKENIYKYRQNQDKVAEAELLFALKNIDAITLRHLVTRLPKKWLEVFCHDTNPKLLAEESIMKLEIRSVGMIDKVKKTDGIYRLILHKNMDRIQVHFSRKDSFVLYLIYLIDKYERDTVDSLNIKNYREQFCNLYNASYHESGREQFNNMVNGKNENNETKQKQIKHCYRDITLSIAESCEKLRERPEPFMLKDEQSHLYVLRNNIILPTELIELTKV